MKRIILIILILCACSALGCVDGAAGESEKMTEQNDTTIPETETEAATEAVTTAEPETYFVKVEWLDTEKAYKGEQTVFEEAVKICDKMAVYGYRVYDSKGNEVYYPLGYTQLQCNILRESKRVTEYCRKNGFKYGDAPKNPAIDNTAKKVSCDRLVCWVMYNVGFTKQPKTQGVVVSAMAQWCERQGFEKITRIKELQAGDIILVNPNSDGVAGHTFIYAGVTDTKSVYYRYDCGSNERIQSQQPFSEGISGFICGYRPAKK